MDKQMCLLTPKFMSRPMETDAERVSYFLLDGLSLIVAAQGRSVEETRERIRDLAVMVRMVRDHIPKRIYEELDRRVLSRKDCMEITETDLRQAARGIEECFGPSVKLHFPHSRADKKGA